MTKTKTNNNIHRPLVITGYILFATLIIGTVLSTSIPWGLILANSDSKTLHINVVVFLVALTIGAFLPVLLGYIIGDHSIKSKSKIRHHFNGVLFGLLSFWIMTICALLLTARIDWLNSDPNARVIVVNLLPSVIAVTIGLALTLTHVRSRQAKDDILEYKPFSILLIAAILVLPVWPLLQNVTDNSVNIYSFITLILIVIPGCISYFTLGRKMKAYKKLAWSAVAVSVFFVMSTVLSILLSVITTYVLKDPTWETYTTFTWIGYVLAFIGWLVYWVLQVKALRNDKK